MLDYCTTRIIAAEHSKFLYAANCNALCRPIRKKLTRIDGETLQLHIIRVYSERAFPQSLYIPRRTLRPNATGGHKGLSSQRQCIAIKLI